MLKPVLIAALLVTASPALAACPPELPESMPGAIEANSRRIVCLQNELAAATAQRKYEFDLKALENRIQDLELRQRLNTLPKPAPYTPPPVFR